MNSDDNNPFGDIEQDNNPSFYGNPSVLHDPYGRNTVESTDEDEDDSTLFDRSVGAVGAAHTAHSGEGAHRETHGSSTAAAPGAAATASHPSPGVGSNHPKRKPNHAKGASHGAHQSNGGLSINDSLVISSKIASLINQGKPEVSVAILSTEKLVSSSSVVVYCIELRLASTSVGQGIIVKRRYSEFKSLRDNLMRLFPTLIIPPIPQKHSLLTYLITSINNNEEISIIETRKRLFELFLKDLIFHSNERVRNCVLLHKFLDPNYESSWENAINEPPMTLVPDNLLLGNPVDPTNQNGLYSLLPVLNGYEPGSTGSDNLASLKRLNEDLQKIRVSERAEMLIEEDESVKGSAGAEANGENATGAATLEFKEVPASLIHFEARFNHSIKTIADLDKLNGKTSAHLKALIGTLIELGSNLNNFSLQVHSPHMETEPSLAAQIEKFGSTIDSVYLNYESFTMASFVPTWQEPVHQLIQHYLTAVHLLRFYKLKLIQFKLLKKAKLRKTVELESITSSLDSQQNINEALRTGLELNSPSITEAVKKFEQKQRKYKKSLSVRQKKSWYGLFGGKGVSNLNYETLKQANDQNGGDSAAGSTQASNTTNNSNNNDGLYATTEISNAQQFQFKNKIEQIDREIAKLDQLIQLTNSDMVELTEELERNFQEFTKLLEKRWLKIILEFIRGGKKLFEENLQAWEGFKADVPSKT